MTKKVLNAIDNMNMRFSYMNNKVDRLSNILYHKFGCVHFSEILHQDMAHAYKNILLDEIVELKTLFGFDSNYPTVIGAINTYETLYDLFLDLYEETEKTKEQILELIDICREDGSIDFSYFVVEIFKNFMKYVQSTRILMIKSKDYNILSFDVEAPIWYIRVGESS